MANPFHQTSRLPTLITSRIAMKTKDWMVVSCSCDGCTSIILQGYRQYHKSEVESFVGLPWISLLRWLTAWQHQPREDPWAKELSNHSDQTRPRQAYKLHKCHAVNRMPGEMHAFTGHHLFHWDTSLNICMSPMCGSLSSQIHCNIKRSWHQWYNHKEKPLMQTYVNLKEMPAVYWI